MADPKIVLTAVDKTKAAFDSAKRNFDGLKTAGDGLLVKFGSIATAITAAFEGITLKHVLDEADQLNKLSQKTGIAVESLSALKYAGELADVSIEDLANGIKKLQVNQAAAAGGGKEQIAVFDAIGVKATTASGALRNTDDVLGDIAEKFSSYKDGAGKAALATELFGKNGASLIPFLNNGRRGLAELRDEAEKLGIVFGGNLAKDAEEFNDNLTRLGAAARGAKVALLGELLPALIDITNQFIDARKAYGSFTAGFLDVLNGSTVAGGLEKTRDEIAKVKGDLADLEKRQASPALGDRLDTLLTSRSNDKLKEQIALLEKRKTFQESQQQRAALLLGRDVTESNPRLRGPTAGEAPIVKKGSAAADDALQQLKKNLQGSVQAIDQSLAAEQDLIRFNQTFLDRAYQTGNVSLAAYYESQDELRRRNLEEQRIATAALIAEEEKYQIQLRQKGGKESDVTESANRIAAARAKLATAERDFQQASDLSKLDRGDALAKQARALDVFRGQMQDLVDDTRTRAAELAEIAVRVADTKARLVQAGVDPAEAESQAQAQRGVLLNLREFNLARDEFTRVTDKARDAEEALSIVQRANGVGLLDSERQVTALREKQLEQLRKVIDVTREAANKAPQNEALQQGLRDAELAFARLQQMADATKVRLDAAAENLGSGIADTIGRAVVEGGKLKDILNDIGKQIASTVTQEAIVKPLSAEIGNFIKGAGGKGLGENLIGLITGQGSKGGPGAAASGVAGATTSFASLQTLGIDPTTQAFLSLQAAMSGAGLGGAGGAKSTSGGGLLEGFLGLFGSKSAAGGSAGTGLEGLSATALEGYFDEGGFTGHRGVREPAGVVHGKEFVFSAPAVSALGVNYLDNMHRAARAGRVRGYAEGGYVGQTPGGSRDSWSRPMPSVQIFQSFAPGTTQQTADQAAVKAGREVSRAIGRGNA